MVEEKVADKLAQLTARIARLRAQKVSHIGQLFAKLMEQPLRRRLRQAILVKRLESHIPTLQKGATVRRMERTAEGNKGIFQSSLTANSGRHS